MAVVFPWQLVQCWLQSCVFARAVFVGTAEPRISMLLPLRSRANFRYTGAVNEQLAKKRSKDVRKVSNLTSERLRVIERLGGYRETVSQLEAANDPDDYVGQAELAKARVNLADMEKRLVDIENEIKRRKVLQDNTAVNKKLGINKIAQEYNKKILQMAHTHQVKVLDAAVATADADADAAVAVAVAVAVAAAVAVAVAAVVAVAASDGIRCALFPLPRSRCRVSRHVRTAWMRKPPSSTRLRGSRARRRCCGK